MCELVPATFTVITASRCPTIIYVIKSFHDKDSTFLI